MWAFSGSGEQIDPTMHMSDPDFKEQEWTMLLLDKKQIDDRFFSIWLNDTENQVELESDNIDYGKLTKGIVYQKAAGTTDLKPMSTKPIAEGNEAYGSYDSSHTWQWRQPHYRSYVGYPLISVGWHPHPYRSYWYYGRPWRSHFGTRWSYRSHHRGWHGYRSTYRFRGRRTMGGSRFGGSRFGGSRSGSSFRTGGRSSGGSWGGSRGGK
jgi:hypothetical protein